MKYEMFAKAIRYDGAVRIIWPEDKYVSALLIRTWAEDLYVDSGCAGEKPITLLDCIELLGSDGKVTFGIAE